VVDILAVSRDPAIDLTGIVGNAATLALDAGYQHVAERKRSWTGIVSSADQLRGIDHGLLQDKMRSTYSLRIVPKLWLLSQRSNHRIFQHLSVPEIVKKVLKDWSIEADWQIGEYPKLEFKTQYGESDFAFITRLLEGVGISYLHRDVEGETKLLFSDKINEEPIRSHGALLFVDSPNEAAQREFCTKVNLNASVRPNKSTFVDYDFRKPGTPITADTSKTMDSAHGDLHTRHYRPATSLRRQEGTNGGNTPVADDKGVYRRDPSEADRKVNTSLDGMRTGNTSAAFETNVLGLSPGTLVKIEEHPHPYLQNDLLIHRNEITGTHDGHWDIDVEGVRARDPFAPVRKTPKPKIAGPQSATVVGPEGEEIHVDEYGRVRVQFPWDEEGKSDESSSVWMRVVQGWAGVGFGMITIPRIGQEVLVSFLDGDPDVPMIVGRLYNETNPVPYPLPHNKTVSGWKTHSTPKDDGYNEIKLEDKAKKELIYIQAQRDLHQLVKRDQTEKVGRHHHMTVDENQHLVVKKSKRELVKENDHLHVGGSRFQRIDSSTSLIVGQRYLLEADQQVHLVSGNKLVLEAKEILTIKGPGGFVTIHPGGVDIVGKIVNINSGGSPATADDAEKHEEAEEAQPKDSSDLIDPLAAPTTLEA
jgi:type VI secretion system secreted protein VgrG